MNEKSAVVVGSGLMGRDIAAIFLAAGWATQVIERNASRWADVRRSIAAATAQIGRFDDGLLTMRGSIPEVEWAGVRVALESVREDLGVKRTVFAELDAHAPADAVLGSNSSSLRITDISAGCAGSARMANTHFFQPAHLVPLVEIAKGESTSDSTVDTLHAIFASLGRAPVRINRDVPGFLANRIQHALMREAFAVIDSGLATAEDVDIAVKFGFGFRYVAAGPMLLKEFAGFDTQHAAATAIYPSLSNATSPGTTLSGLVAEGRFGMKVQKGFRDWTPESIERERIRYEATLMKAAALLESPDAGTGS